MKKWKVVLLMLLLLVNGALLVAGALQQEQHVMANKLIRLHVVANSDTEEDQAEKLLVRDAVLRVTEPLVEGAGDPRKALSEAIPQIEAAARACLQNENSDHDVIVTMAHERFPTRYYDGFALPAGVYPSLRVSIGAGEGQNWWCVAFPSVCFCATADELETKAVSAGFSEDEVRLITGEGGYVLKFKILELLGEIKAEIFS